MESFNPNTFVLDIKQLEKFNRNIQIQKAEETLKKYSHLKITDLTEIPPPIEVIKINGEIISTEGNITTISGASKSGKSAFSSVLIAGAIAKGDYDGFPDVEVSFNDGKAVLHFDTEQARHKHQKNLKTIFKRVGVENCPENLLSYNIREEDLEKYKQITLELVEAAFKKFNGIHLIVIDGGADYIKDVNEPRQSNEIVKFFEELAIKFSTAVVIIVHVNPNSDKERGHFGSQLQRKSESVLSVKTTGDVSCIEPKLLRMAGKGNIPLIQFAFDKDKGYHDFCGIKKAENSEIKDLKRITEIGELARNVFAPPNSMGYSIAIERIMNQSKKKIATAKGLFKEMKAHKMIEKGVDGNWRLNMDYEVV